MIDAVDAAVLRRQQLEELSGAFVRKPVTPRGLSRLTGHLKTSYGAGRRGRGGRTRALLPTIDREAQLELVQSSDEDDSQPQHTGSALDLLVANGDWEAYVAAHVDADVENHLILRALEDEEDFFRTLEAEIAAEVALVLSKGVEDAKKRIERLNRAIDRHVREGHMLQAIRCHTRKFELELALHQHAALPAAA